MLESCAQSVAAVGLYPSVWMHAESVEMHYGDSRSVYGLHGEHAITKTTWWAYERFDGFQFLSSLRQLAYDGSEYVQLTQEAPQTAKSKIAAILMVDASLHLAFGRAEFSQGFALTVLSDGDVCFFFWGRGIGLRSNSTTPYRLSGRSLSESSPSTASWGWCLAECLTID